MWLELRCQGVRVGRKYVERLTRTHGLQRRPSATRLRWRDIRAGQLIFHSDKGAHRAAVHPAPRRGRGRPLDRRHCDSFDNALAENLWSTWSTIKIEPISWPGTTFASRLRIEA
jgi:hypothetical protein